MSTFQHHPAAEGRLVGVSTRQDTVGRSVSNLAARPKSPSHHGHPRWGKARKSPSVDAALGRDPRPASSSRSRPVRVPWVANRTPASRWLPSTETRSLPVVRPQVPNLAFWGPPGAPGPGPLPSLRWPPVSPGTRRLRYVCTRSSASFLNLPIRTLVGSGSTLIRGCFTSRSLTNSVCKDPLSKQVCRRT